MASTLYDRTGHKLSQTSTHYDSLGRVDYATDASGHVKRMTYDSLGRLDSVIQATQGVPQADGKGQYDLVTQFGYDEVGHKIWQADANKHITRFGYDERGRMVWRRLPMGEVEKMSYNDGGQLESSTDFRGYTTTFRYDERGRMLSKVPDAALHEATLTYSYPDENTRIAYRGASATTQSYDKERGWLNSVSGPNGTVSYGYNAEGQKVSITSPSGSTRYGYDVMGRLRAISDQPVGAASATNIAAYGYDAVGNLATLTRGNGVVTRYNYDEQNRLSDLVHAKGANELSRFRYTLRDDGKRTGINEQIINADNSRSTRALGFTYDNAGKLTGESGQDGLGVAYANSWNYDNVGNRIAATKQTAASGSTPAHTTSVSAAFNANDQLTSSSSVLDGGTAQVQTYSYDKNGSEQSVASASGTSTNGWDFEGKLTGTALADANGVASGGSANSFDAAGNRLARVADVGKASQKTTSYLVDIATSFAQVVEERAPDSSDAAGNPVLQARYVWGQGLAPLAMWRKMQDGSVKLFFHLSDGQESVRQLTDSAGVVTDSYFYDAWGNSLAGGSGTTVNPFRYTGQQLDPDGRYYLRARFYNPGNGRFLSHDPLLGQDDDPSSLHRYLYASNDPVNGTDPSGEETLEGLVNSIASSQTVESTKEGRELAIQKQYQRAFSEQIFEFYVYWKFGKQSPGHNVPSGPIALLDSEFHMGIFVSIGGIDEGMSFDVGVYVGQSMTVGRGRSGKGFLETKPARMSEIKDSNGGMSKCITTLNGAQYAAWVDLAIIDYITLDEAVDMESLLTGQFFGELGGLSYGIGPDLRKFSKDMINCVGWTALAAGEAKALGLIKTK